MNQMSLLPPPLPMRHRLRVDGVDWTQVSYANQGPFTLAAPCYIGPFYHPLQHTSMRLYACGRCCAVYTWNGTGTPYRCVCGEFLHMVPYTCPGCRMGSGTPHDHVGDTTKGYCVSTEDAKAADGLLLLSFAKPASTDDGLSTCDTDKGFTTSPGGESLCPVSSTFILPP